MVARTELTQYQHERQQLALERAELQRETEFQLWSHDVYMTARNERGQVLKSCVANDELLKEYAGLRMDLVIEGVQKDAARFIWVNLPVSKNDPKQLEKDRATLEAAAREHGTFGASEANLSLIRDVLGPGFTEYMLTEAIRSNAIGRLAAPSAEEREQWLEEDADKEKLRLLNASTPALKEEVRSGYADRRAQAAQADADRVLDQKREWQTGQFKPLPQTWNGQRLDAAFIRAASPQLIRQLREHYGSLQLDLRLRGEN